MTGRYPFDYISREPGVIRAIVDCNPPHGPIYPLLTSVTERHLMGVCEMCWQRVPEMRPTTQQLLVILGSIFQEHDSDASFPLSGETTSLQWSMPSHTSPQPFNTRADTDTHWFATTAEDLSLPAPFHGAEFFATGISDMASMAINPGPLFVSSSLACNDMSVHFGGSAVSTGSHPPGTADIGPLSSLRSPK